MSDPARLRARRALPRRASCSCTQDTFWATNDLTLMLLSGGVIVGEAIAAGNATIRVVDSCVLSHDRDGVIVA